MKNKLISKKTNNENIRTGRVCADNKAFWTHDEVIGGLYKIERSSFEVKAILSPAQMFKYEKFKVIEIFQWKENIVIVPSKLDKKWIFYNKKNEGLEYKEVTTFEWEISGIHLINDYMLLIPTRKENPIVVINFKTMIFSRLIQNWGCDIFVEHKDIISGVRVGVTANTSAIFYLYDEKYMIVAKRNYIEKYLLDIPYGISSIGYYNHELWILPTVGNYIYKLNETGKILEEILLIVDQQPVFVSDFIKIIVTEKYVFLLPITGKQIHIYNKLEKNINLIDTLKLVIKNTFPIECFTVPYWGYYIEQDNIYIMPLDNQFLIINFNTLECESKNLFLPPYIAGKEIFYWFGWNHWIAKGATNKELNPDSIGLFCEMLKKIDDTYITNSLNSGNVIWEKIKQ